VVKAQLQNAADAAALAGAQRLYSNLQTIRRAAKDVAASNAAAQHPVVLRSAQGEDVEIGHWDEATATFTPMAKIDDQTNAVRVTCRLNADRKSSVDLFFAPVIGVRTTDMMTEAIARADVIECGRFVGLDYVDVASGYVDSYDSRLGTYDSQMPSDDGHVCSDGQIRVQNATVSGNASPGEGYNVFLQGGGGVSGSTESHVGDTEAPPVSPGNAAVVNDNDAIPHRYWDGRGNLTIPQSQSADFPGGTLYVEGSLKLNGELRINGPTVIYVEGHVSIQGQGLVNQTQLPKNLTLLPLGLKKPAKVEVQGTSDFYGTIYAPTCSVKLAGGADFFGAILGESLDLSTNGGVHYDAALPPFNEHFVRPKLVQ